MIQFHLGWGMRLRNEFHLWDEDSELLKTCAARKRAKWIHPDDASMMIIGAVWDKVQAE